MWQGKRISIILPTFNEKDSIARCIDDFFALGYVDEVIVIDNNAAPGTREEVERTGGTMIVEPEQGYGHASRRGFRETSGDIIVLCEPDGTFLARDLDKLLAYSQDFDIVYGSRTLGWMIWENANMGWFLRLGNVIVAKMIQALFNCRSLSDVGCTYRLLSREASDFLLPHYRVGREHFGPEIMLRSILASCRVVQIPVNYLERVGQSSVTGSRWKAFRLGMRMIFMIFEFRIGSWLKISKYTMPNFQERAPRDEGTPR
ncbi:MAG TPA: glycosyltransferase family 2 protein [Patescibacteria group bacterium]|nr:glycosyltransferase family 2 protein [Patescibacteria group bacterium]